MPQIEQPERFADDYSLFEERAAICEHDGGLSPAHAEVLAALHEVAPANVIDAAARFLDRRVGSVAATLPPTRALAHDKS